MAECLGVRGGGDPESDTGKRFTDFQIQRVKGDWDGTEHLLNH